MLLWKDSACSTYLSEVYKDLDPAIQVVCLQVTETGNLLTDDEPYIVMASAGAELAASFARNKKVLSLLALLEYHQRDEFITDFPGTLLVQT
jgi:hypothetical protein